MRLYLGPLCFLSVLPLLVAGTSGPVAVRRADAQGIAPAQERRESSADAGVRLSDVSRTVQAGDDFFTYANQAWLDTVSFPPGATTTGAFEEAARRVRDRVMAIIDDAASLKLTRADAGAQKGPQAQTGDQALRQIGALHASFVDTARIEERGLDPLRDELDRLLALSTHEDVARWMADPMSSSVVLSDVTVDAGDPRRTLLILASAEFGQSMLGLPNAEFYTRDDAPYPSQRVAYRAYVAATLERAGVPEPVRRAGDVLDIETAIAREHWTPTQLNDRRANYHLLHRGDLGSYAPGFPWQAFLDARGVSHVDDLVLATDTTVRAVAQQFAATAVDAWRSYLAFHWVQNHAELLPAAYGTASFEFYGRTLRGATQMQPRETRAARFVSDRLGQLVGRLYVARHFPSQAKGQAEMMIGYLRRAFDARLASADWMDTATRREARAKLASLVIKIGHPDAWRDYAHVTIDASDLVGNVRRLRAADWADRRARLDRPVRRTDWNQTPQTVDASASATINAIEFPAGILQPPFFDPQADAAANFGAIGAIIGHEMGHGFDDQGSRFDESGRLRDWWTAGSRRRFDARTDALVAQFNGYEPLPGVRINGRQTLPENAADLTGLAVAHDAYRLYVRDRQDGAAPTIGGLTGDQRFFLAHAQAWRVRHTDASLREKLQTDSHSPAMYRVNGVVRNLDGWYEAFNVRPAHRLYLPRDARVTIW